MKDSVMTTSPEALEIRLTSLADLAIEYWRLDRWLSGFESHQATIVGRHVARRLDRFLKEQEIAVLDVTGQPYEPGLAVEIIDTIADDDTPDGTGIIDETVTPVVLWKGLVIRQGQVVTRRRILRPPSHHEERRNQ